MSRLPVEHIIPELLTALACHPQVILQAPPGAGKTTRVPLAILESSGFENQKLILLEPRRLAARNAAQYMAGQLGEPVGQRVGFRTRLETRVSANTRIEVVTEGILTRMLQHDPSLDGIGVVIFDEFHERNLHGDLGLALALETQSVLREDLRLILMSATLDTGGLKKILPHAPVLVSAGRSYPVTIHYARQTDSQPDIAMIGATVRQALAENEGDLLVFLPGAREISQLARNLESVSDCLVLPLYGDLPPAEQEKVFQPAANATRKVVLATSIAESSLTFDGVRGVVDAGWMRLPRFDFRSGMTRLETVKVSKASADQRTGRAGRQAAGVCYRCWTEGAHQRLSEQTPAEIQDADLVPLALELAVWGAYDPSSLRWIDPPSAIGMTVARQLLRQLGALDRDDRITAHGRSMAELGMHPRLAHMVLRAREWRVEALGVALAVLLGERDVVRVRGVQRTTDLTERVRWLVGNHFLDGTDLRTRERLRQLARRGCLGKFESRADPDEWVGRLVAQAFPDRVAQRREGRDPRYLLRQGRGAVLPLNDSLVSEPWLAIAELDGDPREARIFLAASFSLALLERDFGDQINTEQTVQWDDQKEGVTALERRRLGALILQEKVIRTVSPELIQAALLEEIRQRGLDVLPWNVESERLRNRVLFIHSLPGQQEQWPDWSADGLLVTVSDWLEAWLQGMSRLAHVSRLDMSAVLRAQLSRDQLLRLDKWAPESFLAPSGSRVSIDYSQPAEPVLAIKLQELFGLAQTPCIGGGEVPLLLHLLSPARRPVQITRDLSGFWSGSYLQVKKEMKGRYPKHPWPDNPIEAKATRWVKARAK